MKIYKIISSDWDGHSYTCNVEKDISLKCKKERWASFEELKKQRGYNTKNQRVLWER